VYAFRACQRFLRISHRPRLLLLLLYSNLAGISLVILPSGIFVASPSRPFAFSGDNSSKFFWFSPSTSLIYFVPFPEIFLSSFTVNLLFALGRPFFLTRLSISPFQIARPPFNRSPLGSVLLYSYYGKNLFLSCESPFFLTILLTLLIFCNSACGLF